MKPSVFLFLSALVAGLLGAQTPDFGIEGVRIFGGDAGLSWGNLKLTLGGGWETIKVGRDGAGEPRPAADPQESDTVLDGVAQARQKWVFEEADLWIAAGGLGHGDLGLGNQSPGFAADRNGGALLFFQAGTTRDRRKVNAHRVTSGTFVEAFVEVGPKAFSRRSTEYYKVSLATSAFVPLWDVEGGAQVFSGVIGLRANARWIDGDPVPLFLLEPTEVRGYQRLLDTRFRSVATTELRVGLPSLAGEADLVPIVLLFTEGGWYSGYANAPASASDRRGWLASVGTGMGLSVFGAATPTLTLALPLTEETALWWKLNFNLRF